jgi:hypothetical protein
MALTATFRLYAEEIEVGCSPLYLQGNIVVAPFDSTRDVGTIHCKEQTLVGGCHGARCLLEQFDIRMV